MCHFLDYDMDIEQVSPKLSISSFKRDLKVQFPTNFDYFGYNEKIINKLKQETNVRNYLQIEKKLLQQKEERKMEQRQKKKLQEKAKIQNQRQRNKSVWYRLMTNFNL